MKIPMPWFIPIGLGLGLAGTRTAVLLHKLWGKARRNEIIVLAFMAWVPFLVWAIAGSMGRAE